MFRNYLLTSVRNLRRDRIYAAINIGGLALAMACCLLITLWIRQHLTYDRFHPGADRLYQVEEEIRRTDGFYRWRAGSGMALGPLIADNLPAVETVCRVFRRDAIVQAESTPFREPVLYVDSDFFDLFGFTFRYGNRASALQDGSGVVLSSRLARKLFGAEEPLGQRLRFDNRRDFVVTGVLDESIHRSHITPDIVAPCAALRAELPGLFDHWDAPAWTYVRLQLSTTPESAERLITTLAARHYVEPGMQLAYHLTLVEDIHLHPETAGQLEPGVSPGTLLIYAIAAALILLLAAANFVSLSIARATNRLKELGVRKVLGGTRRDLILQYLTESGVLAIIAAACSVVLAEVAAQTFATLTGTPCDVRLAMPVLWLAVIGMVLLVGILAGLYPALYLSRLSPASTLTGRKQRAAWLIGRRNLLITVQFGLSVLLLMCAAAGHEQIRFMTDFALGFPTDNTAVIPLGENSDQLGPVLKQEILRQPGVEAVCAASNVIGGSDCYGLTYSQAGQAEQFSLPTFWVDEDFLTFMDLRTPDGSAISSSRGSRLYVTESAARKLSLRHGPETILQAWGGGTRPWYETPVGAIIKDFHYRNLYNNNPALALIVDPSGCDYLYVRTTPGIDATGALTAVWNRLAPGRPWEGFSLDEFLQANYSEDYRFASALTYAALLALIVACMGLLALSAYLVAERTREVGVRRVLGASMFSIVWFFSRRFLPALVLSVALATPAAYWLANQWLKGFIFRTHLSPVLFAAVGGFVIALALGGVAVQALLAVRENPIKSLRYE